MPPPPGKGGKGTRVPSKTLYEEKDFHVDVENPGNRPGQIHMQFKGYSEKFYYDIQGKVFRVNSSNGQLAPSWVQEYLNNDNVIKAIGKGLKILGYEL